ncbi:MAG: alpha-glucosidase [Ignavibacteriales bacterium CG18_big_fil_WC_8_21_14_2_50_31_20]|nr:MAG: alpha-glucosidase [Ignavibacteriales bacterium CG18_big_fil_WC_8_21_14_2_50_31_20]
MIAFILVFFATTSCTSSNNEVEIVYSPSKNIEVSFQLLKDGTPTYSINFNGENIIKTSKLGFDFKRLSSIKDNFKIVDVQKNSFNETWEMPWGEAKEVVNNYNEIIVTLQNSDIDISKFNIHFKVYDDGVGFRYEFPQQNNIDSLIVLDENTQFSLTGNHTCWWIPGDWDIYEHLYNKTRFAKIDALAKANHDNLAQTYIPENAVNTPITMRTSNGTHLSFHEANLTNYPGMTLKIDKENLLMSSELVGSKRFGYKAKVKLPFNTPWRTIQIAKKATELIDSKLIVNLNEPNKLGDVSWFKPTKYMGIWWEMHLSKSQWSYSTNGKPHGLHGATTENAKAFIDFASQNGIGGLLVEGWNTGWENWIGFDDREGVFDFVTPYPDYNLKEVVQYGKEKSVEIIMHHETSAAPRTYEQQLDTAFALMKRLGISAVKTGYVGKIIPKGEFHHGQWMVNHYRKVIETAAKYDVAVNAHEPIKATGIRRTYPNAISREGLRGQEFNAWSSDGGNPPNHLPTVAFTRMLAGPIDFTPGVFNIKLKPYKPNNQVNTTLAQQLALYVVIYSPIQMACDLIENYKNQPAFQFINDVGVDWDKTITLNGEVGEFVTIARKEKNKENWFVGSITNEISRDAEIDFGFLDSGLKYNATIYQDGKNAHWNDNPTDIEISKMIIDRNSKIDFHLASGGGLAISLIAAE